MKDGVQKHRDERSLFDKGNFLYEGPEEREYRLLSRHRKKFIRAMKMTGELRRENLIRLDWILQTVGKTPEGFRGE